MSHPIHLRKIWIIAFAIIAVALLGVMIAFYPDGASAWVEALATVGLGLFAWRQLDREERAQRRRQEEEVARRVNREKTAATRAGTAATFLTRQLRSWLGLQPHLGGGIGEWVETSFRKQTLQRHLDRGETRITELANLASRTSPSTAHDLRNAFEHFLTGTGVISRIVDQFAIQGKTAHITHAPEEWYEEAGQELALCLDLLEKHLSASGESNTGVT